MTTLTVAPPAPPAAPTTPATPAGNPLVDKLKARFPQAVQNVTEFRGETTIQIRPEDLLNVGRFLRDDPEMRFNMLTDVTGYDRLVMGRKPRFVGVYQLLSIPNNHRLRLTVEAPNDNNPTLPSVTGLWPTANWHEREAYDLLGIRYAGHPDLRRILMPFDWIGHPLRKDYAVGAEEVPFTVTWDDPEFASLGHQILPTESKPAPVPPNMHPNSTEHMVLNMGPQHPSTHGVLRVALELDGEHVVNASPDIGYLHSGFEKQGEQVRWKDFVYYTDRTDYLSSMGNNLGYSMAVEKLLGLEIPPRAQVIRVIMAELQRIASHLVWLGTHVLDISGAGMSVLMYGLREREQILDLFEMCCGARLTYSYIRVGGVWKDVPPAFFPTIKNIIEVFPGRFDEYEAMLTESPLWRERVEGVGKLSAEDAIALGVTGPLLRASGVPWDLRKTQPYSGYQNYDFEVPTATGGDTYARYLVRMAEMRQSIRIIKQAVENMPDGPYISNDRKVVAPPRAELDTSMEALIHHFKLWTEGFTTPPGMVYHGIENPKGELGYFLVSDGTPRPYRLRIRGPSFVNLQALPLMSKGAAIADLVAIIGTIDIVLGEVDR